MVESGIEISESMNVRRVYLITSLSICLGLVTASGLLGVAAHTPRSLPSSYDDASHSSAGAPVGDHAAGPALSARPASQRRHVVPGPTAPPQPDRTMADGNATKESLVNHAESTAPTLLPAGGRPDASGREHPVAPVPSNLSPEMERSRARQAVDIELEQFLCHWGPGVDEQVAPVEIAEEGEWAVSVVEWQNDPVASSDLVHILASADLIPAGAESVLRIHATESDTRWNSVAGQLGHLSSDHVVAGDDWTGAERTSPPNIVLYSDGGLLYALNLEERNPSVVGKDMAVCASLLHDSARDIYTPTELPEDIVLSDGYQFNHGLLSPTGDQLVYVEAKCNDVDCLPDYKVWLVTTSDHTGQLIFSSETGPADLLLSPVIWSSTTAKIVFDSSAPTADIPFRGLWTYDLKRQSLSSMELGFGGYNGRVWLSPDERYLLFPGFDSSDAPSLPLPLGTPTNLVKIFDLVIGEPAVLVRRPDSSEYFIRGWIPASSLVTLEQISESESPKGSENTILAIPPATSGFQRPMSNDHYGWEWLDWTGTLYHPGDDYNGPGAGNADCGTDIHAVANGTIRYVNTGSWGGIVAEHDWQGTTVYSQYGHVSTALVSEGQNVSKGQHIAEMGSVGDPGYTCHLHWEIREADHPGSTYGAYWDTVLLSNLDMVNNYYEDPEWWVDNHGSYGDCPQSGGAILYWNNSYNCDNDQGDPGYRQRTSTGWENVSGAFNDQASSLRVPSGWSVRLYEHSDRNGASICRNSADSDFAGDSYTGGVGLNDTVSSFEVFDNSNCGTTVDAAQFVSQSEYPTVQAGQQFSIFFEVRNTGDTTWRDSDGYGLENINDLPLGAWPRQEIGDDVPPGATKRWDIQMIAPSNPGVYRTQWMLKHWDQTFGPFMFIDVTVVQPHDTKPPTGQITSPPDGAVIGTCPLLIQAEASDDDSGVGHVEFHAWYDSSWHHLGDDSISPYSWNWDCSSAGEQGVWLTIHVWDNAGNEVVDPGVPVYITISSAVSVHAEYVSDHIVQPGQVFSPTITIRVDSGPLDPSRGDHLANTDDSDFGAMPVQPIHDIVAAGFSYTFDTTNDPSFAMTAPTSEGDHTSTWRVWADGNYASDDIVIDITVDGTPPDVRITSPTDGDALSTNAIAVEAFASDDRTGMNQVEFFTGYDDGTGWDWHPYWDSNGSDGWSMPWDASSVADQHVSFSVYAWDNAWNGAWGPLIGIGLDRTPPSSAVDPLNATQGSATFTVTWGGDDNLSGIVDHGVQFRDGASGIWTDWYSCTISTSASFDGVNGHTYYFRSRAQDNAGNWEAYPIIPDYDTYTSVQVDDEAPTGSILINNNDSYSSDATVNLTLSASDDLSVTDMRLFYNGSWHDWETYASSKGVTLTGGDGAQLVSVQYRDAAGNTSSTYSDTIILDTTPPSGSISIDSGATYASSTPVTLALSATDSGSGVVEMRFSNDGSSWSSWESYTASKSWTLTSGDGAKTVYVESRDAAGNASTTYSDSIILDTVPPTSAVDGLPATHDSIDIKVSWSGSDDTSGVACYAVQHRDGPDGTWDDWQYCTTDIRATFTGAAGHTYYFRSRAQDNAGNWEAYPPSPDYDTFTTLAQPPWPPPNPYSVFLPIITVE